MFELHRRTPQDLARTGHEFVRDIETFVAGTIAASTAPPAPASLIERAWALNGSNRDWLSWGRSGMTMTGEQIAAHADAAADWLRTQGWNPSHSARRGIRHALPHGIDTDPGHRFSTDTALALDRIFELLIGALTGAPHANPDAWEDHPARRVEEVFGLLAAAAVFARTYGPAAATARAV
ncbi:hypothetical protein OG582_39400 (plasmid) [Streptomyces anulatus]|uniref:DUF6197 family protein n=1 Tax=Streptomyces TaxID=1883 RepID=UPI0002419BFC|nr:hypothetical protein [Streptomyces sp. W007]EHM31519.1 hypothetical protein SPW_0099 [Streptomyces sp. W007]